MGKGHKYQNLAWSMWGPSQNHSFQGIRSAESTSKAPSPAWDSQFQNIFAVKQLKKINIPSQAEISHKLFLKWRWTLLLCI